MKIKRNILLVIILVLLFSEHARAQTQEKEQQNKTANTTLTATVQRAAFAISRQPVAPADNPLVSKAATILTQGAPVIVGHQENDRSVTMPDPRVQTWLHTTVADELTQNNYYEIFARIHYVLDKWH
jgi:hypothetical protein